MGLMFNLGVYVCTTLAVYSALYCYAYFTQSKPRKPSTKVVRFTRYNAACFSHFHLNEVTHEGCAVEHKLHLIQFIQSAKTKIIICIFHVTLEEVVHEIIKQHKKGLDVRLISDFSMTNRFSKIYLLQEAGVPVVLLGDNNSRMHSKFVVIDDSKCIFGSMNWTKSSFCGNEENIVITDDEEIIEPLVEYFEIEWEKQTQLVSTASVPQNSLLS